MLFYSFLLGYFIYCLCHNKLHIFFLENFQKIKTKENKRKIVTFFELFSKKTQKTIAAKVLHCSSKRVVFASEHLSDIKEAITRHDIRALVNQGLIIKIQKKGVSRVRARKLQIQKRKGRKHGQGSRKGKKTARASKKRPG